MTTPLEERLDTMDPVAVVEFLIWLVERPVAVIELVHRYPPATRVHHNGGTHLVIGYAETDREDHAHLIVTPGDRLPADNEEAIAHSFTLCPGRLQRETECN